MGSAPWAPLLEAVGNHLDGLASTPPCEDAVRGTMSPGVPGPAGGAEPHEPMTKHLPALGADTPGPGRGELLAAADREGEIREEQRLSVCPARLIRGPRPEGDRLPHRLWNKLPS